MAKIILQGHIQVPADELQNVTEALKVHTDLTLAETGCLIFRVTPSAEVAGRFEVYEEFADRQAFDHHQVRVKSSDWGRITANVERFYETFEQKT